MFSKSHNNLSQKIRFFSYRNSLALVLILCAFNTNAVTVNLKRISPVNENLTLHGSFGDKCHQCNVIVNYGGKFKYRYKASAWSDNQITFKLLDLGKAVNLKISVKTKKGITNALPYRIRKEIITGKQTKPDNFYTYNFTHNDKFGGKGSESVNPSTTQAQCNQSSFIFDHAKLKFKKQRFGNARILTMPKPGCVKCSPIKIQWYHEPTGVLDYSVIIQRRKVYGICKNNIIK